MKPVYAVQRFAGLLRRRPAVIGDDPVAAGESGSVGIGLLDLIANHPDFHALRQALNIGPDATVLLFNTEGATDPDNYCKILWYGKYPSFTGAPEN